MGFLEKRNAENLRDFAQAALDFQFFLQNRDQEINADGDPELGLDGILGSSVEGLDPEILFDPFEEELHLPAAFVELGNDQSWKIEIVGQESQIFLSVDIEVANAAQRIGIILGGPRPFEQNCVEGAGFQNQFVEDVDVVGLSFGDLDKTRDVAAQVQ